MKTLVLTTEDLYTLVRRVGVDPLMDQLIERMTTALRRYDGAKTEIVTRTGFYYDTPGTGLIEWMPLYQRHTNVLMKIVGYHPESPASHRLPTILSTLSQYDTATGHLAALVDGTFLTAMRTGAESAVASRLLAPPDSTRLGLIGCGAQAVTQLHSISRVFALREVLIFDIAPDVCRSFPARAQPILPPALRIRSVPLEQLLEQCDIISVATSVGVGQGPVFEDTATRPWVHFNAVGSDLPGKTELPRQLLEESFICADFPDQACREGECQQLEGRPPAAGLVDILRRPDAFGHVRQQRTVFDSTGWALEDQVAMDLVLEHARALAIGRQLAIECVPRDPHHPYEFLQRRDAPISAPLTGT